MKCPSQPSKELCIRPQGNVSEALGKYAMALSYVNEDFLVQLEGPHAERAHTLRLPIHLNMAACQLRLQDWQGAVWNCSQVRGACCATR